MSRTTKRSGFSLSTFSSKIYGNSHTVFNGLIHDYGTSKAFKSPLTTELTIYSESGNKTVPEKRLS